MIRGTFAWIIGIVVLLAFAASSTHSLEYAPGYGDFTFLVNGTWLIAPAFAHFGMDTWEPFVAETVMWYENFTGKAVVLEEMTHGRSPEATIKRTLKMGAAKGYGKPIAILSPSPAGIAGFGLIARDYSNMEWLKIPTVDISLPVYLLAKGLSEAHYPAKLGFVIRSDDSNAVGNSWSFGSVIVSAAFLASLCLCCFVVNIYKFQIHIRYTSGLTTAKIFFAIDLVANFMRFWYVAVNPYFLSGFDYTWTTMCSATHVALSIICTLLLALKWRELLLKTKLKVTLFLTTFKWPFLVAATCIFLLEFISSALRGHWYNATTITQVSLSILIVLSFIVSMLLFISGIQILVHLSAAVGSKRRIWTLSRTTFLILFSGIGIFLWSMFQLSYIVRVYSVKNATVFFAQLISILSFAALLLSSLLQNWAMPFPPGVGPASKGGTTAPTRSEGSVRHSVNITHSHVITSGSPSVTSRNNDTDQDEDEDSDDSNVKLKPYVDGDDEESGDTSSREVSTTENDSDEDDDESDSDEESSSASSTIQYKKPDGKKEPSTSSSDSDSSSESR